MGPAGGGKNWSLTHWDGDTFKLLLGTDDANATAVSAVRFDLSEPKATLWLASTTTARRKVAARSAVLTDLLGPMALHHSG